MVYDFDKNIVLSGSSSLINGLKERIQKNVSETCNTYVKVIYSKDPRYYERFGGSIFINISTFPQMVVTKYEFK